MNLLSSFLNHLASLPFAGERNGTEKPSIPAFSAEFASLIAPRSGQAGGSPTLVESGFVQPGDAGNGLPVGGHALPFLPDPVVESPLSPEELPLRGGKTTSDRFVPEDPSSALRFTKRVRIDAFGAPAARSDAPAEIAASPVTAADRVPEALAARETRPSGAASAEIATLSHGDAQIPLQGLAIATMRSPRDGMPAENPGLEFRSAATAAVSVNPVAESRSAFDTDARARSMAIDEFPSHGRAGVMPGDGQAPAAARSDITPALSVSAESELTSERESGAPPLMRRRIDLRTAVRDLSGEEGGANVRRDYAAAVTAPGPLSVAEKGARGVHEGMPATREAAPDPGLAHVSGARRIDAGTLSALRVGQPRGDFAQIPSADASVRSEAGRAESGSSRTLRPRLEPAQTQRASGESSPVSRDTETPARGGPGPVMEQATRSAPGGQGWPLSGSVSAGPVTIPDSGAERNTSGATADPDAIAADTAGKVRTTSPKLPNESVSPGAPAPVPNAKPNEPVLTRNSGETRARPDAESITAGRTMSTESPTRFATAEPAPASQGGARDKAFAESAHAVRGGPNNHQGSLAEADARPERSPGSASAPIGHKRTAPVDTGSAARVAQPDRMTSATHADAFGPERVAPPVSAVESDSAALAGSEAGRRSHELAASQASGFTTDKGSLLTGIRLVAGEAPFARVPGQEPAASHTLQPAPGTERWADALGDRVMLMLRTEQGFARLTLNPEQLGPMEVRLKVQDDQAQLWLNAQHPQAREALESALPRLRELLSEQGLDLMHQNAGEQQQARGQRNRAYERTTHQPAGDAQAAPSDEQGRRPGGNHDGLIDHYA